jgi:hypothetical protein
MMDWFPAVMALVGVLVGVGVQELRLWRERKDKYKDMIFEKRVEAHQGAYYRCYRLQEFLLPYRLVKDGGIKALDGELYRYKDWLNKNALYLDGVSRTKIYMFLYYAVKTGRKYGDRQWIKNMDVREETLALNGNLAETLNSIQKGIGVKYLPEEEIQIEGSLVEGLVGDVVEGMERMVREEQKEEGKGAE